MKITMYELLGMIKNGKTPKRIIYDGYVYQWNNIIKNYEREVDINTTLNWDYIAIECLNDEVEVCSTGLTLKEATELSLKETTEKFYKISEGLANKKRKKEDEILDKIEEKKIPEKLGTNRIINTKDILEFEMIQNKMNAEYTYVINEIIDYLKSKGDE